MLILPDNAYWLTENGMRIPRKCGAGNNAAAPFQRNPVNVTHRNKQ
ncbi:MAG: hypothetical protein ABL875_02275 [Candidatus Nitrotoga sp.]